MFKTYLRTLIKSIRYTATFLGVWVLGGALTYVVAILFLKLSGIPTLIILGTPTLVTFIVSINVRQDYNDIARSYQKSCDTCHLRVGEDLKRMFCTKEFWIEVLVFCHYVAALCLIGGRIIFRNVLEGILIVVGCVILYIILNAASWLIVHRAYLKDKIV